MDEKVILVTGIGGNVGQGIIRNIRSLERGIKIIGCDIAEFSPGNHLCDRTYQVPYSYDSNYIPTIQEIVNKEKIDLIIPSTDYEVYYLSSNKKVINGVVLSSDAEISKVFLDKYLTYLCFKENNIPFSNSWLPSKYDYSCKEFIAKPREGRGSRGIMVNPSDISELGDDYMIQALHKGIEVTTAVYVNKSGRIHGLFTLERKLDNGTTSQTVINDKYDDKLMEIASKIVKLGGIRGSFNIQSIVDQNGEVNPFEINCRISGTNSIRHNLGFQDVKYAIEEFLYDEKPSTVQIQKGIATRILMDVIYLGADSFGELNNKNSNHYIY